MFAATAAATLIAAASVPLAAHAQNLGTFSPVTVYGTIGYAGSNGDGVDLGAIQGRLGARFGNYVGLEGELAGGVKNDHVTVGATDVEVKLRHQEAIYGVGFVPLSPRFDLVARVGYGHQDIRASAAGVSDTGGLDSWNYGGGGQYFFDNNNGLRVDYTRHDFTGNNGGANVWSVGYVRKF
jgi:hypothetical protein